MTAQAVPTWVIGLRFFEPSFLGGRGREVIAQTHSFSEHNFGHSF